MPVFIRVGGKRVSAACCSLVRFLQNTASCAHQLFFHRVLHNANIFDINGLLSSWAIPESHLHLPRPVKGYHDGAVVSGFFVSELGLFNGLAPLRLSFHKRTKR